MKIKTRQQITAAFSICLVIIIGFTLFVASQQANKAAAEHDVAQEIVNDAFELIVITDEFILHQEARPQTQWQLKHDLLSKHLTGLDLANLKEQTTLDRIHRNSEDAKPIFSQLVASYDGQETGGEASEALQKILTAQLSVKLQTIVSDSSILAEASHGRLIAAQQTASLLVTIFIVIIAGTIGVNSWVIINTIAKPITKLHHGTEIIGDGDLDYKVGTSAKDEVGQLSRAFDQMTEKLKAHTEALGERVKELDCLYGISKLSEQPGIELDRLLEGTVALIPPAWHYPDVTCVRIIVSKKKFETANFKETRWKQSAPIKMRGKKVGAVEVYYLEEKPEREEGPFLKEERALINSIAAGLSRIIESKQAEEDKIKTMGQVARSIGHDIRNPLHAIRLAGGVLKDATGKQKQDLLELIDRDVVYADRIIRNLMDFSQLPPPKLYRGDINSLLQETLEQIVLPENVTLTTKYGDIPKVTIDREQMNRVFTNLILNATQAIPEGSTGLLEISTGKASNFIEIKIKDTGGGIPEEKFEEIFSPFYTTKAKGSGLGLPTAKRIITAHKGTITVESEEGKGATVTIRLPINPP